jgi:hypothetical protein
VSNVTQQGLYPAEHRALRELHAAGANVAGHWARLARRRGGEATLEQGAAAAHELLAELSERTAAHGLHGFPAAQVVGGRALAARGGSDVLLERNQAFRMAVLDLQHTTTLLAYLAELADTRGDADLAAWHRRWEARLRAIEDAARTAAAAQGSDPARAIEPADTGRLGRAGQSIAAGLGTLGEAIDGSPIGRAARRLRR